MKAPIFYSWQSDTKAAANRTLILDALEGAAKELRADGSFSVEPVIERDTQGVPGAPDIGGLISPMRIAAWVRATALLITSFFIRLTDLPCRTSLERK